MTDTARARWYAVADRVNPSYDLLATVVIGGLFVSGRFYPTDDRSTSWAVVGWVIAGAMLLATSLLERRRLNGDWIPREVRTAAGMEPALIAPRSFVADAAWTTGLLAVAAPGARWAGSPSFDGWDDVGLVVGISMLTAACYLWMTDDLPRLRCHGGVAVTASGVSVDGKLYRWSDIDAISTDPKATRVLLQLGPGRGRKKISLMSHRYTVDQDRLVSVLRHFSRHPEQLARFGTPGQRLTDLLPTR